MRVLITGISGFLGRHLAPKLLAEGYEVYGIRLEGGEPREGVVETQVDILDRSALNGVVSEMAPETVIHLAGLSHVGRSWDRMPQYFATNVLGVENIVAAAPGARIVLASSSEVYGSVPSASQPIPESRRPAPRNPYGLTKAAAERLALASGGIVVRMFNLVGPGQETAFALPSFAAQLADQRELDSAVLKVGNLEARRDFVHVSDGATAFVKLVERGEAREIYNLGSGTAVSIQEALDRLIEITGMTVSVEVDAERLRPVDVPLLCADTSKLNALGWRSRRGLNGALEDLWQATKASTPVAHGSA
ncbi:MAG: NAD-dependent epimerase/dehydratase family protein [bacterium]|nr:NAD-dependent epimerase/dehydratase family protein [bacterium]